MIRLIRYQYLAILWAAFVLFLCNIRIDDRITGEGFFFIGFDKLTHCGCFFVFTVLLLRGRVRQKNNYSYSIGTILILLAVSAVLGGAIEVLQQYLFTYRSAEWWDFACDLLGTGMALFSYVVLHRMRSLEMHHPPSTTYVYREGTLKISLPLGEDGKQK